jgi:hypothetical protein
MLDIHDVINAQFRLETREGVETKFVTLSFKEDDKQKTYEEGNNFGEFEPSYLTTSRIAQLNENVHWA